MTTVSIRDLARGASAVVAGVARTGRPAIVARYGKPVAAVVAIDPDALEDWVLANAPEFVRGMKAAEAEYARGQTAGLEDFLAGLDRPAAAKRLAGDKALRLADKTGRPAVARPGKISVRKEAAPGKVPKAGPTRARAH
ncbi:MAG: hypothetical protein WDA71_00750 [Actinomycetota bacterium]